VPVPPPRMFRLPRRPPRAASLLHALFCLAWIDWRYGLLESAEFARLHAVILDLKRSLVS